MMFVAWIRMNGICPMWRVCNSLPRRVPSRWPNTVCFSIYHSRRRVSRFSCLSWFCMNFCFPAYNCAFAGPYLCFLLLIVSFIFITQMNVSLRNDFLHSSWFRPIIDHVLVWDLTISYCSFVIGVGPTFCWRMSFPNTKHLGKGSLRCGT